MELVPSQKSETRLVTVDGNVLDLVVRRMIAAEERQKRMEQQQLKGAECLSRMEKQQLEDAERTKRMERTESIRNIPNAATLKEDNDLRQLFAFIAAVHHKNPACRGVPQLFFNHPKLMSILEYVEDHCGRMPSEEDVSDMIPDKVPMVLLAWRLTVEFLCTVCPRIYSSFTAYAEHFSKGTGGKPKLKNFVREERNIPLLRQLAPIKDRYANVLTTLGTFHHMTWLVSTEENTGYYTVPVFLDCKTRPKLGISKTVYSKTGPRITGKKRKAPAVGLLETPVVLPNIRCEADVPATIDGYPAISFRAYCRTRRNLELT